MQTDQAMELMLRFEPGTATVAGTVDDPTVRRLTFEGWLGLAATLEVFLRGERAERDEAQSWRPT
jgi:hypothetical protein